MLYALCQQIWKTQQWPQDWKRSVFIPIPKKGNAKECSSEWVKVAQSCPTLCNPMDWSGLPFPSPKNCQTTAQLHSSHPAAAAAAAAAKSIQSCPTLCDPIDGSPPGSPVPGILQARTLEWVAISFSNAWKWKLKGKSLSRVQLLATPWTAA